MPVDRRKGIAMDDDQYMNEDDLKQVFLDATRDLPRPGIHLDGIRNRLELHLHLDHPDVVEAVVSLLKAADSVEVTGDVPVKVRFGSADD